LHKNIEKLKQIFAEKQKAIQASVSVSATAKVNNVPH
jgi:hypothetical protein